MFTTYTLAFAIVLLSAIAIEDLKLGQNRSVTRISSPDTGLENNCVIDAIEINEK